MQQASQQAQNNTAQAFWTWPVPDAYDKLNSSGNGLSAAEAQARLKQYGPNTVKASRKLGPVALFLKQFKSPITLILIGAGILSISLGSATDAYIIFSIIGISSLLGYWQEKGASEAVSKLLALVKIRAAVLRDGKETEIPVEEVVPGDMVILNAGDIVPGDCLLIQADELYLDEAAFTGETFPVDKEPGTLQADIALAKRSNTLLMGSHVISGKGQALVIHTGLDTEFGHISQSLKQRQPETEFERGIRRFGYLLMEITMILVVLIFGINVFLHKPVLDSLLFALAIAVGLTPQLLPAIISVNLSQGARRMAAEQVIVKRLSAIENFGSMDVFCSDKTGTLTEGKVKIDAYTDYKGSVYPKTLLFAKLNARMQQGFINPIDEAICALGTEDTAAYRAVDEIPYDFIRKRLTILAEDQNGLVMISKGALNNILAICTQAEESDGKLLPISEIQQQVDKQYQAFSEQGYRTLGIAYKTGISTRDISKTDEQGMIFLGFLTLYDPPKAGIRDTIAELKSLGIQLKVITGDNALIAAHIGKEIGLENPRVLTGTDLRHMSVDAIRQRAEHTDIFAEVEPNQKEQILVALKQKRHVVGYMGDGINDASALHAADAGISVDSAVDVAKEAADIVLLNRDLNVLINGVKEGRRTFANTLKYIFMATSANFGNMFSMAGASVFLPFLPLLPRQILLTNLLTDLPEMTIASDHVDENWIQRPHKWDIRFIRRFMVVFGLLSSVFDYITFGVLLLLLHAGEHEFQTGWFVESVVSASLIVLVIRSRLTFFKSRPGKYLLAATLFIAALTLLIPFLGLGRLFGFIPLPFYFYAALGGVIVAYIIMAELIKHWFFKRFAKTF